MASELEKLAAALRRLAQDATRLRPFVRDTAAKQRAMLSELQAIGARLPEAGPAVRSLAASIDATTKVDASLATVDRIAAAFADRVLGGGAGRPAAPDGAVPPTALGPNPAGDPGGTATGPGATSAGPASAVAEDAVPDWVTELAASLRYPDSEQTVGRLALPNGERVGDQIMSGRIGPGANLEGLREDLPQRPHLWKSVREHVEGHAAAIMRRRGGVQHMVLVVSQPPCPYNRPSEDGAMYKRSCDVALPHITRKGSTLTVYVAEHGKPPRFFKTYIGTGKGIKE